MSKKTICFLFETPILESYYHRYGMNYLEQNGYRILALDLSPILNLSANNSVTSDLVNYDDKRYSVILSKEQFNSTISGFDSNVLVIVTFSFERKFFFIYKELTTQNISYGNLSRMDTGIEISTKENFGMKLKSYVNNLTLEKVYSSILYRFPKKWFHLKAADFIIFGGTQNSELYYKINLCDERTKVEYIHSFDYEIFLDIKDKKPSEKLDKYCVFIDQYLPYHPDRSQDDFCINANQYYHELKQFFKLIEEILNIKVIVSAHPRSDYSKHPDVYEDFTLVKGKTAELIKDCEFAFTHFSTAVSYAVLFEKPLFFITNDEIDNFPLKRKYVQLYAAELGTSVLNLSQATEINSLHLLKTLTLNKACYDSYIEHYIKKEFKEVNRFDSFWKRFIELIDGSKKLSD